jgi:NADP-dependent aldehyde dehydrogenase
VTTQSMDPRTGIAFGPELEDSSDEQVRETCIAARRAGAGWSALAPARRAGVLEALADALDAQSARLVSLADSETALGSVRLTGELARTTFQLRMLADAVRDGSYTTPLVDEAVGGAPPAGHAEMRRSFMALGPVAVYAASNFPFAFSVAGGDTGSALAAGCTVVVKAHPGHPQTSEAVHGILCEALTAARIPASVVGMVRGFRAGSTLIQDPAIRAGAFTGSQRGGRALFDLATGRPDPIPFYGELGSVNPVVVLPSAAARPTLAKDYADSLLMGAGQFCTNPSILFVPAGAALVDEIVAEVSGREAGVLLYPGVLEQLERSVEHVAAAAGVTVLSGSLGSGSAAGSRGLSRSPLLFGVPAAELLADRTPLAVECFGPVGVVAQYQSSLELLAVLASMEGALAACVHGETTDPDARAVVAALADRAGRVAWNAWPTGVSVNRAQNHGGPWPATTSPLHTSVGVTAIRRFLRPVAFQSVPVELLPSGLAASESTTNPATDQS